MPRSQAVQRGRDETKKSPACCSRWGESIGRKRAGPPALCSVSRLLWLTLSYPLAGGIFAGLMVASHMSARAARAQGPRARGRGPPVARTEVRVAASSPAPVTIYQSLRLCHAEQELALGGLVDDGVDVRLVVEHQMSRSDVNALGHARQRTPSRLGIQQACCEVGLHRSGLGRASIGDCADQVHDEHGRSTSGKLARQFWLIRERSPNSRCVDAPFGASRCQGGR